MPTDFNHQTPMTEKEMMEQEYSKLMQGSKSNSQKPEWTTEGQYFEKFSLYPDYVPSRTCDYTPVMGSI